MKIKNKILSAIEIERMAAEGKCIAHSDGKVVFVPYVAPGDVADLRIIRKKKNYLEAVPEHFHKMSEERAEPFCAHFGTCGGCKWQHIEYRDQLAFKQQQVTDAMERIAKIKPERSNDIIRSDATRYYRNKLEFTFSNKRWLTREEIESGEDLERRALGFHIPGRFDKILDIDTCYLQSDPTNDLRLWVRDYGRKHDLAFYDIIEQKGDLRNLIIRTSSTGELMVIVQFASDKPQIREAMLSAMMKEFPRITSLNYVINQKKNETFNDLPVQTFHGREFIYESMRRPDKPEKSLRFRVGPKSFYQTNSEQAEVLYKVAYDMAGLTGREVVYDLYTGTGTIANYVAHRADKVIGIEYVEDAVADARLNSIENHIENTSFHAGDMKDLLSPAFIAKHGKPDVVITDPPRAGMHEAVVNVLLEAAPERIVYVSCNPSTQARDIALLATKYSLEEIQPVDMFPQTHHVENVALLVRKDQ